MTKNYYVFRTDDDSKEWIWKGIEAGQLRQGWGLEGMQLKENGFDVTDTEWIKSFIKLAKEKWDLAVTESQAKARYWILKPMAMAKPGDVVLIPKMPSWDTFTLAIVDEPGYVFDHSPTEQRGRRDDFRHTLYVKETRRFSYFKSEKTRFIKGKMRAYQSAVNNVWSTDFQRVMDELLTIESDERSRSVRDIYRDMKQVAVSKTLDEINKLTPRDVETLVHDLFKEEDGYEVRRLNDFDKKGGDADLVLGMNIPLISKALGKSLTVYVQVKQKKGIDISDIDAVKQVIQIATDAICLKMVISTADDFTAPAKELAELSNVLLINGGELAQLLIEKL
jgi:hypothetical protein